MVAHTGVVVFLFCTLLTRALSQRATTTNNEAKDYLIWKSLGQDPKQNLFIPQRPVEVQVHVNLQSLSAYDRLSSSVSVRYKMMMTWSDSTFIWDDKKFNQNEIAVPTSLIWVPDVVPPETTFQRKPYGDYASVLHFGYIRKDDVCSTKVSCRSGIRYSSGRECDLTFGSWVHRASALNISVGNFQRRLYNYDELEASGWTYVGSSTKVELKRFPCCSEPSPELVITLKLRRSNRNFPRRVMMASANSRHEATLVLLLWSLILIIIARALA